MFLKNVLGDLASNYRGARQSSVDMFFGFLIRFHLMMRTLDTKAWVTLLVTAGLLSVACSGDDSSGDGDGDGDGDGEIAGDGDAPTGDGDLPAGDGDGDVPIGDGDGNVVGDGDGDTPITGVGDGPGEPLTREQYCEQRISLEGPWCDYIDECCLQTDIDDLNFIVPTCAYGQTTIDECVSNFDGVLEAGVVWDGTWAAACVIELAKLYPSPPLSCSGLALEDWSGSTKTLPGYGQIEACQQMLQGNKQMNEPCDYDAECNDGLHCATITGEATGDYQCLPLGDSGTKCFSDGDCIAELRCVEMLDDRRCGVQAGTSGDCLYDSDCQEGLVCDLGTCGTAVGPGGDCSDFGRCEGAYGCAFLDQICISLGRSGDACSFSSQCAGRCDTTLEQCVDICGGDLY